MRTRVGEGRYTLVSRKGAGGAGEVWIARDGRLERDVAVKLLRGADSRMAARFRQEALATAALVHPNIVFVSDYFVEDGVAHLVMELLSGVSLAELVHALGPLDPARAVKLAIDVCSALQFAHERGVLHRDIKPANVQVVPEAGSDEAQAGERAIVLDFGIAKLADATSLTEDGSMVGTPCFMAPEQVMGAPPMPQIDVYATGLTLQYALTATLALPGSTPHEVISALVAGKLRALGALRPDLDPELVAIVERATAYQPERRYPTAGALGAALSTWSGSKRRSAVEPSAEPAPNTTNIVAHALPTRVEPAIERRRARSRSMTHGIYMLCAIGAVAAIVAIALLVGNREIDDRATSSGSISPPPAASITEIVPLASASSAPPEGSTPRTTATATAPPRPPPTSCARPLWPCAGRCVDLESDRSHCGACAKACAADRACVNGACVACPVGVGFTLCNGRCIRTLDDPNNCGTCGRKCPWGRCQLGRCT